MKRTIFIALFGVTLQLQANSNVATLTDIKESIFYLLKDNKNTQELSSKTSSKAEELSIKQDELATKLTNAENKIIENEKNLQSTNKKLQSTEMRLSNLEPDDSKEDALIMDFVKSNKNLLR